MNLLHKRQNWDSVLLVLCQGYQTLFPMCITRQTSLPPIEQLLQKFWDLDHIGIHIQKNENLKMEEDLTMQKARALTIKEDGH